MGLLRGRFGGDGPNYQVADIYRDLRAQAFGLEQDDRGLSELGEVLAVVMDSDLGDAAYTLFAAADGALSVYFSNGGGIIGTGQRQQVGSMAAAFVDGAAGYSTHLAECADPALPGPGLVRISVVLDGRILSGEFNEDDLGHDRLPLSPLFHQAHQLIGIVQRVDQMRSSEPPLIFAIWTGAADTVQRLLEEGAAVDTASSSGVAAIGVAVRSGEAAIVRQLLHAGADPNARIDSEEAKFSRAPMLCVAAADGDVEMVHALVAAGAKLDAQEQSGLGPLHMASFLGRVPAAIFLLDQGADPELREKAGYTPLMMAANAGQTECVRLLLERGARPSAVDSNNCTPLMFSAQHGHAEIVRLLLESGADPTIVSSYGLSAIGFAEQHGHAEVLELLRAEP